MKTEPDLRFTHDTSILMGRHDTVDNALVYYIGNYPTREVLQNVDRYMKHLKPPNEYWDAVVQTGKSKDTGTGWASTGFESKYTEYLMNNDNAFEQAQHTRARAMVRPIFIGHHPKIEMYSPARVCIQFIRDAITLPSETSEPWETSV